MDNTLINKPTNKSNEIIIFILVFLSTYGLTYCTKFFGLITNSSFYLFFLKYAFYFLLMVISVFALALTRRLNILKPNLKKFYFQFVWGLFIAIILSIILGVIPQLISGGNNQKVLFEPLDFTLTVILYLVFVGPGEEILFRGYFMNQLLIWNKKITWLTPLIVAVMFGLMHVLTTVSVMEAISRFIITTLIGLVFGFLKLYGSYCSLFSVSFGHGLYDLLLYIIDGFLI